MKYLSNRLILFAISHFDHSLFRLKSLEGFVSPSLSCALASLQSQFAIIEYHYVPFTFVKTCWLFRSEKQSESPDYSFLRSSRNTSSLHASFTRVHWHPATARRLSSLSTLLSRPADSNPLTVRSVDWIFYFSLMKLPKGRSSINWSSLRHGFGSRKILYLFAPPPSFFIKQNHQLIISLNPLNSPIS